MTAGSGMTYSDLLAEWNHDPLCSSKTCQGCLLVQAATLWPESFTDWPQSATASLGGLWQQPKLVPLTDGFAGGDSPTLPTPRTSDTNGPGKHGNGGLDLRTAISLLPTRTTVDGQAGTRNDFTLQSPNHTLREVAEYLSASMRPSSNDGKP